MLNRILSILFQASVGPVFGLCIEMVLQPKQTGWPRWMRITVLALIYMVVAVIKTICDSAMAVTLSMFVLNVSLRFVLLCFMYEGRVWVKLGAMLALDLAIMTAECGYFILPGLLDLETLTLDFSQPDMMIGSFIGAMISNSAQVLSTVLWRHIRNQSSMLRYPWLFVIMPICLAIPALRYDSEIWSTGGTADFVNLVSLVASYLFSLLLIFLMFNQANKDTLEKELAETQYWAKLEQQHYQNIEARREEMAKIRHDYNNLLTSVLGLLRMGEPEEAEEALAKLLTRVEQTREYQFCGIPIVNAILSEKQNTCTEQGIRLVTDLLLPEDSGIEQIDLCSVFSNLLDNAIRACGQLPEGADRTISLTAGTRGDYLGIRCDNPSAKAPGQHPEGSGYGTKILKDIAKRYDGEFKTGYEGGVFTATLILLADRSADFAEKTANFAVHP